MEKAKINLIEDQKVEDSEAIIDNWEAEQLLRKYGYEPSKISNYVEKPIEQPGLTFEEMVRQEENRIASERKRKTPTNRDGYNNSETTYSTDEDTGFTFRVQINTDMNLPRY